MEIQKLVAGLFINPKANLSSLDPAIIKEEPVRVAITSLTFSQDREVSETAKSLLNIQPA